MAQAITSEHAASMQNVSNPSIAIDDNGGMHVAYLYENMDPVNPTCEVVYMNNVGGSCLSSRIERLCSATWEHDMAIDANGNWHTAYINWNNNHATKYNIYWGTEPGVTKNSEYGGETTINAFAHTGIIEGSTYYYRIEAVNPVGVSDLSNEESVFVPVTQP